MVMLQQNYTITLIYVHAICTLKGTLFTNSAKWEGYILVDYSVPSEVIITVPIYFISTFFRQLLALLYYTVNSVEIMEPLVVYI